MKHQFILHFGSADQREEFLYTLELAKKVCGSEKVVAAMSCICAEFRSTYEAEYNEKLGDKQMQAFRKKRNVEKPVVEKGNVDEADLL